MPERHPVEERPDLSVEERCRLLEIHLAQLWDQVWWLTEGRAKFESQGFTAPIQSFYLSPHGDD
jgi:hypothetical protein